MKYLGAGILAILTACFGITYWDFTKNQISIKGTVINLCLLFIWLIICFMFDKNKED